MTRPAAIEALKELDPGQRALLDLSLNRELSDSLIAGLLENTDESGVAGMRSEALAAVARAAEIDGPGAAGEVERQLRSASDQQWLGAGETNGDPRGSDDGDADGHAIAAANGHSGGNGVVGTVPARRSQPSKPAAAPRERDRSGRIWAIAFALLALIGAAAIAVALISGDDEAPTTNSGTPAEAREAAPSGGGANQPEAAPVRPLALEALTPGAVAGSATIAPAPDGAGYVLRLEGLPQDGYYRLWAYDSLIESVPVAAVAAGSGSVAFELPADAGEYESLDLSAEDGPGDRIHSGASLFRISLADID